VTWLVVDYFTYVVRQGASAHHAARRQVLRPRRFASRRLVIDYFTYTARSSSSARRAARRRPHVISPLDFSSVGRTGSHRAPDRSVSRFNYSVHRHSTCCPVALLYFSHAMRRDYLSRSNTDSTSCTPRAAMTSSSSRIASTTHLN
jgi:hypothetical protein